MRYIAKAAGFLIQHTAYSYKTALEQRKVVVRSLCRPRDYDRARDVSTEAPCPSVRLVVARGAGKWRIVRWIRNFGITVFAIALITFAREGDAAFAEWFGDLYGGVAFPERTTAHFDQRYPTSATGSVNLNMGTAPAFGARVGRWFDAVAVAVDISYFQRKASAGKIDVIPISPLFMVRLPLYRSEEFPQGQLQPYVGIGPSIFIANGSIASPGTGIDAVNQTRTDFGYDIRVGAAWQLSKRLAVFSEYRFTDVNLRFLDRQCLSASCGPMETTIINETKVSLATHHILVGMRF